MYKHLIDCSIRLVTVLLEYLDQILFSTRYLSLHGLNNCRYGIINFGTAKTVPAGPIAPPLQITKFRIIYCGVNIGTRPFLMLSQVSR